MLMKESRWKEAEEFLKVRVDFSGEHSGLCFTYAKTLFENQKYELALKYFKKSNRSIEVVKNYIVECIQNIDDDDLRSHQNEKNFPGQSITAEQFYDVLVNFSRSISAHNRMHFWDRSKETGKYKWTKNPEEISKQLLISFLNGKFGEGAVEIIQEPRAGAGFIDLYVLLPGGLKVIIELKMCGKGYSSTYALSGESQIIHYQTNKSANLGFLVVFDARVRDYGKHFKRLQSIDNHTIYSIAVDMRPEIDKKS